jgi:hypothetical protein
MLYGKHKYNFSCTILTPAWHEHIFLKTPLNIIISYTAKSSMRRLSTPLSYKLWLRQELSRKSCHLSSDSYSFLEIIYTFLHEHTCKHKCASANTHSLNIFTSVVKILKTFFDVTSVLNPLTPNDL